MKIIAFYLPQFHTFPENDEWWGKGFTEWVNVKSAKALYEGHNQPREPLDDNYYDLSKIEPLRWQAQLAKEYGIYGFCYYHYWFDGHMFMQKPMENMLNDRSIDLPFCICWANENWTKAWAKRSKEVLISQTYGDRNDWKKHFEYFFQFFKDDRYIRVDGKPLLVIYRPELISTLEEMLELWQTMARKKGLKGLAFAYQQSAYDHTKASSGHLFDYGIEYEPNLVKNGEQCKTLPVIIRKALNIISMKLNLPPSKIASVRYDYDDAWRRIISHKPKDSKMLPGAFVDWDNTPRYGKGASMYEGVTPEKFQKYLSEQIKHAKNDYKKDMLFMFAWNEWGEGGYLEPDKKYGFGMLEAIKRALIENDEFPECFGS